MTRKTVYYVSSMFLMMLISGTYLLVGQGVTRSWDDTARTGWPEGFTLEEIISTADGSVQKAWFWKSPSAGASPLIVSLHTWSGDYNQEDPLAVEAVRRGWNYIHPDFRGANTTPEAGASDLVISDIRDAIDFGLRHTGTAPDDVHLIGVSGGGFAVLAAYMKLDFPVRSFNAWAPISDLESWYHESRGRGLKYASDIEGITTGGSGFDPAEARRRSPRFMEYRQGWRKESHLSIYTGITDGYSGSVPITHSTDFYNRITSLRNPGQYQLLVPDSTVITLLARRYNPDTIAGRVLAGRKVIYQAAGTGTSLVIFDGGHEMLVPHALSLIPVKNPETDPSLKASVLVIGDSNGAGHDSWPGRLGVYLPYSQVINSSIPGNTTGFDNLGKPELNTLKSIDNHLDKLSGHLAAGNDDIILLIALGTNDSKEIFRRQQRQVPGNMGAIIDRVHGRLGNSKIYLVAPPPVAESLDTAGKYSGSARRVAEMGKEFRDLAAQKGTGFIDLHALLDGRFESLSVDGVHLNRKAQDEVAAHIASVISPAGLPAGRGQGGGQGGGAVPDTNIILPPAWAFGLLYGGYTDQQGTIDRIGEIMAHDYPIDAYWIDSWFWSFDDKGAGPGGYLDFTGDTISYPDRGRMWSWMEDNGIKGGFWVWDCIQETGNEEAFREFLGKGLFSGVYLNRNPWHNKGTTTAMFSERRDHAGTLCGNINFDDPEAVALFREKMRPFFLEGADFIKLDRTDRISVCRAMYDLTAEEGLESRGRGLILSHSAGTDNDEYKRYPLKWTDDTRSDWTIESPLVKFDPWVPPVALKENIRMYTDPARATSRIPFLTNDLGGFDMGKTEKPEEELYIRWMQFSMFCPVTEVFCQPENPTSNLAWNYSPLADTLFREYSHLRMKLFPYLYSYAHLSRLEGVNMIRPLPGQLYEYMLGDELLIAPVFRRGETTRELFVPEGRWIDYWTGEILDGGRIHQVPAPVRRIPLLVREGAIIPMRQYASSIEKGTNDTLIIDVWPGADRSFRLIEDDGLSNDYLQGGYSMTEITTREADNSLTITVSQVRGRFEGMADSRSIMLSIRRASAKPSKVTVNGRQVQFDYDPDSMIIAISPFQADKRRTSVVSVMF
jgi:pimeloyl-ACP methyl ester carboxylesterase